MELIKSYAIVLVFTAFVAAISEMLLSSTPYKKYVKVIVGFVMILAIISPIANLTNQDLSFQGYKASDVASVDYKQEYTSAIIKKYSEDLTQKLVSALAQENITIDSADFKIDENEDSENYMKIISLTIKCQTAAGDEDKIRKTAVDLFGITNDNVQVEQ